MSKTREFFVQSAYNSIEYNSTTGLYDIKSGSTLIASTIRIFNPTNLKYDSSNNGYFYLSMETSSPSKYIYLDGSNPDLDMSYLDYSIKNISITNDILLEIHLGTSPNTRLTISPKSLYSDIKTSLNPTSSTITDVKGRLCINFAFEQDSKIRAKQILLLEKNSAYNTYNGYNCISSLSTPLGSVIPSPVSGAPALSTGGLLPNIEPSGSNGTSVVSPVSSTINIEGSTLSCNSNNMNIKEYNIYYMYGLTFLNGLLIIISIALILLLVDDKGKK
jgi:hypothetical protein